MTSNLKIDKNEIIKKKLRLAAIEKEKQEIKYALVTRHLSFTEKRALKKKFKETNKERKLLIKQVAMAEGKTPMVEWFKKKDKQYADLEKSNQK